MIRSAQIATAPPHAGLAGAPVNHCVWRMINAKKASDYFINHFNGLMIYIEEGTISLLAKQAKEERLPYLAAVVRANLVALLLITFVGAMKVLPARLASPDFLLIHY